MLRSVQGWIAAITVGALIAGHAAPALAEGYGNDLNQATEPAPIVVDAGILRPAGIVATVAGVALFVPVGLFTLMTRPTEIAKPFHELVIEPAKFTWVDPLGSH